MIGVLVMLNNYFHDMASALLLCCAVVMMTLIPRARAERGAEAEAFVVEVYGKMSVVATASLVWILIGGIIRTLAYRAYEWSDAAGRGQIPALVGKHIFFFILVGAGGYLWLKLRANVMEIKKRGEEIKAKGKHRNTECAEKFL